MDDQGLAEEIERIKNKMEGFRGMGVNPLNALSHQQENSTKILKYFLDNKPDAIFTGFPNNDPTKLDAQGQSALHYLFGSADMLNLVLDKYPLNIDIKNQDGETALMKAAEYGYDQSAAELFKRGADLKATDNKGQNIAHKIARQFKERDKKGQLSVIDLLRKHNQLKMLWEQKDSSEKTPADYAKENTKPFDVESKSCGEVLIENVTEQLQIWERTKHYIDTINENKAIAPLAHLILQPAADQIFDTLLEKNPGLILREYKRTPTYLEQVMSWFKKQDPLSLYDINSLDNQSGKGPLHDLCISKNMLKTFVDKFGINNIDINVQDSQGRTPMMQAAQYSNPESIKYLIDHNANIAAHDKSGQNLLHKLTKYSKETEQSVSIINLVYKQDLNLFKILWEQKDKDGKTPEDYAKANTKGANKELLEKASLLLGNSNKITRRHSIATTGNHGTKEQARRSAESQSITR
jgi:ankyrin repeat protein